VCGKGCRKETVVLIVGVEVLLLRDDGVVVWTTRTGERKRERGEVSGGWHVQRDRSVHVCVRREGGGGGGSRVATQNSTSSSCQTPPHNKR
jgi:hypothetical protein